MTDQAPLTKRLTADTVALTKGAEFAAPLGPAPFAGKVSSVTWIAGSTLTGANTNTITFKLVNKGQSGSGTNVIAEKSFTSGVNAPASDETTITLSGTASKLEVAEGDVLTLEAVKVGEGIVTPAGEIQARVTRS
jgi:hypothetical protein